MGANRRAQERARLVALAAEQAKRAEAEAKAIVDAQEIVAIWNAERVVSQLADREARPVAFYHGTEPPSAQNAAGDTT